MSEDSGREKSIFNKAFFKTIIILVLGGLLVSSPLIFFFTQPHSNDDVKIENIDFIDDNGDTIYEGMTITFTSPISGFLLKSLILHQSSYNFKWDLGFYGISVQGGTSNVTIMAGINETLILPNTELGVAVFFTFLGDPTVFSFIDYVLPEFVLPEADTIIGVYFNETYKGGWIEKDLRKRIYQDLKAEMRDIEDLDFRIIRLVDPTLGLYMDSYKGKKYWTVLATDVLPSKLLPTSTRRTSSLSDYIDDGGQLIILGGNPFAYKGESNGKTLEAYNLIDQIFFNPVITLESIVTDKSETMFLTDLGEGVLNGEASSYQVEKPVSVEFLKRYGHDYESLGSSVNGEYLDPAIVYYKNISTIVFIRPQQITSPQDSKDITRLGAKVIEYMLKKEKGSQIEITKQLGFDLSGDGLIDALKLQIQNKEAWERLTTISLTVGGTTNVYDVEFTRNEDADGVSQYIEILLEDQISPGTAFDIELAVTNDNDEISDLTIKSSGTAPEITDIDVLLYENKEIQNYQDGQISSALVSLKSRFDSQSVSYQSISQELMEYIIVNKITDMQIIDFVNAMPEGLLEGNTFNSWFNAGGEYISLGSLIGLSLINKEGQLITGRLSSFSDATGVPISAIISGNFTFAATSIGEIVGINTPFISEVALNSASLNGSSIMALSADGPNIGAFIETIGNGSYTYLPNKRSQLQLDEYYGTIDLITGVVPSLDLNDTSTITDVTWYKVNSTSPVTFLNLQIQSFKSSGTKIRTIEVNGEPVAFNIETIITGIANRYTVLLNQSTPILDGDSVTITVTLEDGYSFQYQEVVTSGNSPLIYLQDATESNFFGKKVSINSISTSDPIVISSRQMEILIDKSIRPVVVNLNDYLSTRYYSEDLSNSKLLGWIANGGKFVHFGPLFGQIVRNSTIQTYSDTIMDQLFGGQVYSFSQNSEFILDENVLITDFPINISNLELFNYNVTNIFNTTELTAGIAITGSGDGYDFGAGTLVVVSGEFENWILNRIISVLQLEA